MHPEIYMSMKMNIIQGLKAIWEVWWTSVELYQE